MNKITINGVEIEFDQDVDVSVDGTKITIKAKPRAEVVHEHHYHFHSAPLPWLGTPIYTPVIQPPLNPWGTITVGTPPNTWDGSTSGSVSFALN